MSNDRRTKSAQAGGKNITPADRRGQPQNSRKLPRTRRRRGSKKLYILLTALIAAVVVTILSCTVLFDLRTITVTGQTRYSPDQVITASGLSTGMNLVRLNAKKAKSAIQKALPYAETVKVEKKFPFDLVITITEPTLEAAVQSGSQIYIVSGKGRVLGTTDTTAGRIIFDGLPIGGDENGPAVTDMEMLDRLVTVVEAIKTQGIADVTLVRSSGEANSTFIYQGRVTVSLGSLDELAYKMRISAYLLTNKVRADERGTLDVTLPGEGRFKPEKAAASGQTASEGSSGASTSSPATSGGVASSAGTSGAVSSMVTSSATSVASQKP